MGSARLLDAPWPDDLDPATVPFRKRSVTILRRMGYYDDPSLFNTLTESEVWSWINAGVKTVADIRDRGNEAIREHNGRAALLKRIEDDLAAVAEEPWSEHVWYRDPRFKEYLPKGDGTVHDIVTSGTQEDRETLWANLEALRGAVAVQVALTLPEAVAQYVGAVTGWYGRKLGVVLAVVGLNGRDPITQSEGARLLSVSPQAIRQSIQRLWRRRDWARPPAGAWMPRVGDAERQGWPDGYTEAGIETTRGFFTSPGN